MGSLFGPTESSHKKRWEGVGWLGPDAKPFDHTWIIFLSPAYSLFHLLSTLFLHLLFPFFFPFLSIAPTPLLTCCAVLCQYSVHPLLSWLLVSLDVFMEISFSYFFCLFLVESNMHTIFNFGLVHIVQIYHSCSNINQTLCAVF